MITMPNRQAVSRRGAVEESERSAGGLQQLTSVQGTVSDQVIGYCLSDQNV